MYKVFQLILFKRISPTTPYDYSYCKKIYKSPHTLLNPYKSMHKESPECNKCQQKFQTIYDKDTHFENNHKRTVDRELSERTKPSKSKKSNL